MKLSLKLKNLLLYSVLLMLPMFASSCSDDDNNNGLNGTMWEGIEKLSNYEYRVSIYFYENTYNEIITEEYTNGKIHTTTYAGTYVYNDSRVVLTDEDGYVEDANIVGDKLLFTGEGDEDEDDFIIFYRKK